jgi:hypothetical protein
MPLRWAVPICLAGSLAIAVVEARGQQRKGVPGPRSSRREVGGVRLAFAGGLNASPPPAMELPLSRLVVEPAVAGELGLTPEEVSAARLAVARLEDKLQSKLLKVARQAGGPAGPAQFKDTAEAIMTAYRELDGQIQSLLGPERFRRLKQNQSQHEALAGLV